MGDYSIVSRTHTHTHARTHAHAHTRARTHARTHAHTHTHILSLSLTLVTLVDGCWLFSSSGVSRRTFNASLLLDSVTVCATCTRHTCGVPQLCPRETCVCQRTAHSIYVIHVTIMAHLKENSNVIHVAIMAHLRENSIWLMISMYLSWHNWEYQDNLYHTCLSDATYVMSHGYDGTNHMSTDISYFMLCRYQGTCMSQSIQFLYSKVHVYAWCHSPYAILEQWLLGQLCSLHIPFLSLLLPLLWLILAGL